MLFYRALHTLHEQAPELEGWLRVRSTDCSCTGPGFSSQHLHSSSEPPLTPAAEDVMPSSGLKGLLHIHGTHTFIQAHT